MIKRFVITLIRLYQRFISPMLPAACRFTPTCSEYAREAFEKKGLCKAAWMTFVRISKCHPFHPGGYDPVQ
ncbi:MAG TPA: membrane protein insertion efficiency factor YidD [Nitrospirota bacterium]|nr:membrane protein insertion efficiency factor YidD [Nitrospirota bacterium]